MLLQPNAMEMRFYTRVADTELGLIQEELIITGNNSYKTLYNIVFDLCLTVLRK